MNASLQEELRRLNIALAHVGINYSSVSEASRAADLFCAMLGKEKREVPGVSFFVGTCLELMAFQGPGTKGHIGFETDDLERTLSIMEGLGYATDYDHCRQAPDGSLLLAYIQGDFSGFAIHFTHRVKT